MTEWETLGTETIPILQPKWGTKDTDNYNREGQAKRPPSPTLKQKWETLSNDDKVEKKEEEKPPPY